MKKHAAVAVAVTLLVCLASPIFAGGNEDDLKVIKRAVKGGSDSGSEKSARWFKVLVVDKKSGTEVLKLSLPIVIVRCLARSSKDRHVRMEGCDVDFAAALKELEELSPMTLLEIVDDEAIIKVWLE
jgi:hypothetical protein